MIKETMTISVQHPSDYILEPSKVHDGRVYCKYSGINGLTQPCTKGEKHAYSIDSYPVVIKTLTVLVGRLSLSVDWENGPERRLKTFINPLSSCNLKANSADPDRSPRSDLRLHCLPVAQH